jgi:hypothetical protein
MKQERTPQEQAAIDNGSRMIHSFNNTDVYDGHFTGLTKREYFAAMAMQGLIANQSINLHNQPRIVSESVKYADLMLLELEKKKP